MPGDMPGEQRGGHHREKKSQEPQKSRGECGHSHWTLKKRAHPAEKKSPERAETAAEIDVRSAGFGERRAQLGIAESAKKYDESADEPGGKNQFDRADSPGHVAGDEENSRANGVADDDRGRRPQTQTTNQMRRLRTRGALGIHR